MFFRSVLLQDNLTPHVLSEWMVEVYRFDEYVCSVSCWWMVRVLFRFRAGVLAFVLVLTCGVYYYIYYYYIIIFYIIYYTYIYYYYIILYYTLLFLCSSILPSHLLFLKYSSIFLPNLSSSSSFPPPQYSPSPSLLLSFLPSHPYPNPLIQSIRVGSSIYLFIFFQSSIPQTSYLSIFKAIHIYLSFHSIRVGTSITLFIFF